MVPASVYAWRKLSVRVQTGTIRRDISLTHPTNHIGGRVVSLTHTNVEYFWSSRAAVSGCHAMLVALTGSAFGTSQCVCVAQAVCACPKLGPSVGTFRSHTQLTTSEVELFRSLTPMSSTFGRVVLLSQRMPCHAMLVALTGSAFGTSQCVCVAQAVCACPNWDHPSGHFAHTPN